MSLYLSNYNLSMRDVGLSLVTGVSGMPYALRHFKKAQTTGNWGHRVIGVLEALPVAGALVALIERVSAAVRRAIKGPERDVYYVRVVGGNSGQSLLSEEEQWKRKLLAEDWGDPLPV